MRRLIINADDFGLTSGVNRAIIEAQRHGILTSATLMPIGGAFAEAVTLAKSNPELSVGCHLQLVDGSPLSDPAQVSSLLDSAAGAGSGPRFHAQVSPFALGALLGRRLPDQIETEAKAQIRKLQSNGLEVTHLDSHKHTHVLPQVLRPLLRAAQACGIRAIRNPFERLRGMGWGLRPRLWGRWLPVAALNILAAQFREAVRQAGLISPDGTVGIVATGVLDDSLFRVVVKKLPEGTWELVCHPGYCDAELQGVSTRLRKSREQELAVLTDPSSRALLARNGIELISYRELARENS